MSVLRSFYLQIAVFSILIVPIAGAVDGKELKKADSLGPELIEKFRKLDNRPYGVLRAWRTDAGEQGYVSGPGDVITVEVKDFVAWVIWQVDILGAFSDPAIDAAPGPVKEIIKNRAFRKAVELADAVKSGVRGDAGDLLFILGERGFTQYANGLIGKKSGGPDGDLSSPVSVPGEGTMKSFFKQIDDRQTPADVVLPLVLATSNFKDFSAFLPNDDKERLATLLAVEKCRDQLWRQARTNLRLKIDDIVLEENPPLNPDDASVHGRKPRGPNGADYEWFRFRLDENESSGPAWNQLRRAGLSRRPVKLTLVSRFGERRQEVNTLMETSAGGEASGLSFFYLEIASRNWVAVAMGLFSSILVIFAFLAWKTDMICDTNGCFRGDGYRPYSLARAQMAFWFLVVVGAFVFLWIATGQLHVLNETCLWLIGIGSGTALGSAVIAESEPAAGIHTSYRLSRGRGESLEKFRARLSMESDQTAAAAGAAPDGPEKIKLIERRDEVRQQMEDLDRLPTRAWRRVFEDWLTDKRVYSFHRYQMFVWTLVLGMVFVVKVVKYWELPTFDGTTLALMGITSGTYLGFKLQGSQK